MVCIYCINKNHSSTNESWYWLFIKLSFNSLIYNYTAASSECFEVIQDFENALENGDDYDVIIKAGEDPDDKEFRAHSFVLRARSSYFKKALSSDWEKRDDDGNYIFDKPNISPEVFQLILRQVND